MRCTRVTPSPTPSSTWSTASASSASAPPGWRTPRCPAAQRRLRSAVTEGPVTEATISQADVVVAVVPVTDQVNAAPVLSHRVGVVAGEVAGNADQPRRAPQDLGRDRRSQSLTDQGAEGVPVRQEPGQVVQTLVDHAGVSAPLVLDDDRCTVLVDAQRIDAPTVAIAADDVLARQKPHAQHRVHVRLDEALHIRLNLGKTRRNLDDAPIRCVEQLPRGRASSMTRAAVQEPERAATRTSWG